MASPHVPHAPTICNFGSAHAWFVEASASMLRQRSALPQCDSGGSNLITPSWIPAGTNWTAYATALHDGVSPGLAAGVVPRAGSELKIDSGGGGLLSPIASVW